MATRLRLGLLLGVLAHLTACASFNLPARADRPAPTVASGPAVQQLTNSLTVTSARGRLTASQRSQLLARLGREGGASLLNRQLLAMTADAAQTSKDSAQDSSVQVSTGNRATLLIDGPATFAAMFEAIENARSTVLLQSYIIEDTAIAQRLAATLERKRAQGVQVVVLYDAAGSISTANAFFERLRAAGVPTCATNPVNPLMRPGYWGINQRDHRKILVVDRQTGFTGGINISEVYTSGSFSRRGHQTPAAAPAASTAASSPAGAAANGPGWRDTQIQLQGPAAATLEDLVRSTWVAQGCVGDLPPPAPTPASAPAAGQQVVRIVPSSPDGGGSRIYSLLLTAIDASQRSVALTMAYFAPGRDMVDALCDAAQRGVDVQLVLPAKSDFAPVLHAGRSHYSRLLACGVQIHELQTAVLHAKTGVIDGVLSTVGSSNMDWRSFASNDEVNAVVLGEDFGNSMLRMFGQDVAASEHITAAAWRQRPLLQRAKEGLAGLFERLW